MEETSRRGILGWYWSCNSKRINILSDSIECNHPSRNTSSLLYSKCCQIENWRSLIWENIHVNSTTTKDLTLRHDWTRREVPLGFTVDQHAEREVVRQSRGEVSRQQKFSQLTQPIPKPICDRSGHPDNTQDVFVVKGETSRSQEIDEKPFHEELCSSDRSGQPVSRLAWLKLRIICLKKSELSKLTIDQGNLINITSNDKMPLKYIVRLRRSTQTMT